MSMSAGAELMPASKVDLAEFPFEERVVTIAGHPFKFRELSVAENDSCADAARQEDGTINGRTMMRMMIMTSSVDPKLTPDVLASMPQRAYIQMYDAVTTLNTVDFSADEGKA